MGKELLKTSNWQKIVGEFETTQDYSEDNARQIVHEILEAIKQKYIGDKVTAIVNLVKSTQYC